MSSEQEAIQSLSRDELERFRLSRLSKEDLVRECLAAVSYDDVDLVIEEMFNRLWPGWSEQ